MDTKQIQVASAEIYTARSAGPDFCSPDDREAPENCIAVVSEATVSKELFLVLGRAKRGFENQRGDTFNDCASILFQIFPISKKQKH
jgi:hypothetical protein